MLKSREKSEIGGLLMKKHALTLMAIIFMLICACTNTSADNTSDVVVSMQINNPVMEINGVEKEIDEGRSTAPIVLNDRTLVPIRAIIEAFGGSVGWEGETQTVTLNMNENTIKLVIDSDTAYLNNTSHTLDAAPTVVNERTMLPIRFIAEGFNIGVAWEGGPQRVTLVRNTLDKQEYDYLVNNTPPYSGSPYAEINGGVPFFKKYEIIGGSFEYYSELDTLGRCDVCMASVAQDIMPTEKRESISSVTPTGWINKSYDNVPGKYLYNRCHLIGYQLTGENANERNLITGTRYFNVDGMLPFEDRIDDYIDRTGNHVMYRATPLFKDNNLVADGVLLEAYSVEDSGDGISFCVYCYNVQPGIIIDYATGDSRSGGESNSAAITVYRTPRGKKYHFNAQCGGKNSFSVTLDEAIGGGLTPCAKCAA